jgi:serine protease Do
MRTRAFVVAVIVALFSPANALAQDYSAAQVAFQRIPPQQRHMVALMLAAVGHYNGMATGDFNRRLYQAIRAFQQEIGTDPTGVLTEQLQARLNLAGAQVLGSFGLKEVTHPFANAKLFVPLKLIEAENRTSRGIAYEGNFVAVDFSHYAPTDIPFGDLYQRLSLVGPNRQVTYKVLRDQFFVVAGTYGGRWFYSRFHAGGSGASGFTLSWDAEQIPNGYRLAVLMSNLLAVGFPADANPPDSSPLPNPSRPTPPTQPDQRASVSSSGTGFFVTTAGMLLTNAHVVENCGSVWVTSGNAAPSRSRIVRRDAVNDLALIQVDASVSTAAKFRNSIRLGEWVGVFGFPLHGLIARSGNFTQGNVTATAGLLDDSRMLQMSAPVQPGNSGGPVFDQVGNVVAVVASKLNAARVAEINKDIPQNVNFAIKANVATNFLDASGVTFRGPDEGAQLAVPDIAERAKTITAYVECRSAS